MLRLGVGAALLALGVMSAACGGDEGTAASGTSAAGGSTATASGGSTATASGGNSSSGGNSGNGGNGGSGGAACATWLVTYDLAGSVFFIDATLDFTITVDEPYSDDDKMGPGTMTLRFPDDNGAPGDGSVTIVDYSLTQDFVTGINLASVTTDIDATAQDACGVAAGTLAGSTVSWGSGPEMKPYCRDGQVSCTGTLCGIQGSPSEGAPLVFDNDCSEPHPLNDFAFTNGVDDFTMAAATVSMDSNQTSTMTFVGTQTSKMLDPATPACACN